MTDTPLLPYADWERGLLSIGYHVAATSTQGSALFDCKGKANRRVSAYEPNEATACWMRRTGTIDCRCEQGPVTGDAIPPSDLPEFGPTERQFRIIECLQGSEEWDRLRARPTASNFHRIVTPVKGDYTESEKSSAYAAEIVAKRLGVFTESPPSFWMQHGIDNEPHALASYEAANGVTVRKVGFIVPNYTDVYGGSPDGLVGNDGMIEIKCPKPETILRWHGNGGLPDEHRPQIQGLLLISKLPWCDFYGWHPGLTPFQVRVYADDNYQTKIAKAIYKLLEEVERLESLVSVNPDYVNDEYDDEAPIKTNG